MADDGTFNLSKLQLNPFSLDITRTLELIKQICTRYTPSLIVYLSCDDDSSRGGETFTSIFLTQLTVLISKLFLPKFVFCHPKISHTQIKCNTETAEAENLFTVLSFVGFQCDFVHERRNFNWMATRHKRRSSSAVNGLVWVLLLRALLFILNTDSVYNVD